MTPFDLLGAEPETPKIAGFRPGANSQGAAPRKAAVSQEYLQSRLDELGGKAGITTTPEHLAVLRAIFEFGRSVFLTGGGGSGKTTLTRDILIPELTHRGWKFDVLASTGIASTHLNGKTFHSWLGCGLGPQWKDYFNSAAHNISAENRKEFYERTFANWESNPKMKAMINGVKQRLRAAELIIVDEVSMLAGCGFLDYADFKLRTVRGNDKPFGGVQCVFVGDILQLPPVDTTNSETPDWCFNSDSWNNANVLPMELMQVYRQKDPQFIDVLNSIRVGNPITGEQRTFLEQFVPKPATNDQEAAQRQLDAIRRTYLVTTNDSADSTNNTALGWYEGDIVEIPAIFDVREDHIKAHYESVERIKKDLFNGKKARAVLRLKVGLPVLMTVNNPTEGYVNGTKGFVEGFVTTTDGVVERVKVRIPVRDDVTGEAAEKVVMVKARAYSRRASEDPEDVVAPDQQAVINAVREGKPLPHAPSRWPIFRQFPLLPATAITVHSSQGMSLDECAIDVARAFAPGQVYVALSRLRSPQGLVLSSAELPVFADPTAAAYHSRILPAIEAVRQLGETQPR